MATMQEMLMGKKFKEEDETDEVALSKFNAELSKSPVDVGLGEEVVEETQASVPTTDVTINKVISPELQDIQDAQKELAEQQKTTAIDLSAAQAKSDEAQLVELQKGQAAQTKLDNAKKVVQDKHNIEMAKEQANIDTRREELSKMKPQDFWADKSTGDKLKMGIAVLLGAVGQGLTGARTNAAITAMNNTINKDLEKQKGIIDLQIKSLNSRRLDMKTKAAIHSKLLGEFDVRKEVAYSNMQNALKRAELGTKDPERKALLAQNIQEIDQILLKTQEEQAQNVQTRVQEKLTVASDSVPDTKGVSDAYKAIVAGRGNSAASMNEVTQHGVMFLGTNGPNSQSLEEIEKNLTPDEFKKLQLAFRRVRASAKAEDLPIGTGGLLGVAAEMWDLNPGDLFENALPGKGGKYWSHLMQFANDQARYVSGAAIKGSEYMIEMEKFAPRMTSKYSDRMSGAKARRSKLKLYKKVTGDPDLLYFQKAK